MSANVVQRIMVDPMVMAGKPVIAGTRMTVQYILELLAHGISMQQIVLEYPGVTQDDIKACLSFAAQTLEETIYFSGPVCA